MDEVMATLRAREAKYDRLIVSATKFRAFLDQHDGFNGQEWLRQPYNMRMLRDMTAAAYQDVSQSAREVGTRQIIQEIERLERTRDPVLSVMPSHDEGLRGIVPWPDHATASTIVDDLLRETARASRRFRATRAVLIAAFILGLAPGTVLTTLVTVFR